MIDLDLTIWILVIVISIVTIILTMLTSVTKWGDKMVDKYEKDDKKETE